LAYMSMSLPLYLGTECGVAMSRDFLQESLQLVQTISECEVVIPQFSTYFLKNSICY